MSPQNTDNNGGGFGRAASGTANHRDVARAEDLRLLARAFAFMACTATILVFNAPDLWPHLFPH